MLVLLAVAISLGCVAASLRRLWFAYSATGVDPKRLAGALRGKEADGMAKPTLDEVAQALGRDPKTRWERDLAVAIGSPEQGRTAEVNEQLMDLEHASHRWARVPRVCASIATSAGFLLGSLALRQGLLDAEPGGPVEALIMRAIDAVAIGVAGATFCVAVHLHAGKTVKQRLIAVDELVLRLESLRTPLGDEGQGGVASNREQRASGVV
jgi:hypothetical protein